MRAQSAGGDYSYPDAAEKLDKWHRVAGMACSDSADAHVRLRVVLNLMGADLDSEPEPGLSRQQATIEGLVRSVALYLGP